MSSTRGLDSRQGILLTLVLACSQACTDPMFLQDAGVDGGPSKDEPSMEGGSDGEAPSGTDGGSDAASSSSMHDSPSLCGLAASADSPGEDCGDVVHCGNAGDCDVQSRYCCLVFGGVGDACSSEPCGNQMPVACDGAEDCATGSVCCFQGGSTGCATTCAPDKKLCHQDSDCPGGRCVAGRDDLLGRLWLYWGFCG